MNTALHDFLITDLQFIKGLGPVLAARFEELLSGRRVLDFLLHTPVSVLRRPTADTVMGAVAGEPITIVVDVVSHKTGGVFRSGKRAPTQIICRDKMGAQLIVQFFGTSFVDYWLQKMPIGSTRIISGKLEYTGRGTSQTHAGAVINHPDFCEPIENAARIPEFQAIYPLSAGLTQRIMANARDAIFSKLADISDGPEIQVFLTALRAMHYPESPDDIAPENENVMRAAGAELFAHQTAIAMTRARRKRGIAGGSIVGDGHLRARMRADLPFELTNDQEKTITEIETDMARAEPMMRLVQGDVGSGKTIVALFAAMTAAECKCQTAFMAPTDTLAIQHFAKIKPICDALGIVCDILTGRDKGASRREKLVSLRSGRTLIIVGTHALFSDDVLYKKLALCIIDEQHRFGVDQRAALSAKGDNPDVLALSATPIPRTLSMTIYGDMDVSIIAQKPSGRKPIKTTMLPVARVPALAARVRAQIDAGAKVFWVCPLVTESEDMDFAAAENRFTDLQKLFGERVGLVHGQMDKKARDAVMHDFADKNGRVKILVATSVIEVGIDVPDATIMIIENAEKFGLSALHQLRGRVGRGGAQSFCVLVYGDNLSDSGKKRLEILCETDDGFRIAEADLMMRGAGELLGARQSGWTPYHFVDYRAHHDLFKLATMRARDLVESDPMLQSDAGKIARDFMFIFGREIILKS